MLSARVGHLVLPRGMSSRTAPQWQLEGAVCPTQWGGLGTPGQEQSFQKATKETFVFQVLRSLALATLLQALSRHLQWLFQSFVPSCVLASAEQLLHLYLLPMGAATWSHSSILLGACSILPIPAWAWLLEAEGCPLHIGQRMLCSTAVLG